MNTGRDKADSAKSRKSAGAGKNVLPCQGQASPRDQTSISTCFRKSAALAVHVILRREKRSLWSNKCENGGLLEVQQFCFFSLLQDFSESLLLQNCTVNLQVH